MTTIKKLENCEGYKKDIKVDKINEIIDVVNELNKSMKSFQDELVVFSNLIKKAEEKNLKANS